MIKIHDEITKKLEDIRKQVGGEKKPFFPPIPRGRIDEDVDDGEDIKTIIHPSGLLIKDGKPVFAYIRDHSIGVNIGDDPSFHRKIHFTVCQTLIEMKNAGRFQSRYRVTNRDDNKYYVEYANGKTREVLLYPCINCLKVLDYLCYNSQSLREGRRIIENFDAKEALGLVNVHFHLFKMDVRRLRGEHVPAGYAANHVKISNRYRKSNNYTCEVCGVNLSKYQRLTDMHHRDGDKSNNAEKNLHCLCKLCHGKEHSHYRVNPKDAYIIRKLRKEQGIND